MTTITLTNLDLARRIILPRSEKERIRKQEDLDKLLSKGRITKSQYLIFKFTVEEQELISLSVKLQWNVPNYVIYDIERTRHTWEMGLCYTPPLFKVNGGDLNIRELPYSSEKTFLILPKPTTWRRGYKSKSKPTTIKQVNSFDDIAKEMGEMVLGHPADFDGYRAYLYIFQ